LVFENDEGVEKIGSVGLPYCFSLRL